MSLGLVAVSSITNRICGFEAYIRFILNFQYNTYIKHDICILFLMFIIHYRWEIRWEEYWVLQSDWCPRLIDHHNNSTYNLSRNEKVNADIKVCLFVFFSNLSLLLYTFKCVYLIKGLIFNLIDHFKKKPQESVNRRYNITPYPRCC